MFPEQNKDTLQAIHSLFQKGEYQKSLAAIETYEKERAFLPLKEQVELKLLRVKIYDKQQKYQEMLEITDELLNNSQSINETMSLLDTLYFKAKALNRLGQTGKGLAYIKMAEKVIAKGFNAPKKEIYLRRAELLFEKGFVFEQEDELKNSLENYLQSQSLRREIEDLEGLAETNTKVAEIYQRLGDIVRALIMFKQSLEMFQSLNYEVKVAEVYNKIGEIYLWKGEYGPALENCLQSLSIAEETKSNSIKVKAFLSLSTIYSYLGEFDRALIFLNRALNLNQEQENTIDFGKTLCLLSRIRIIKGQLNDAVKNLEQARQIFAKQNYKLGLQTVERLKGILAFQLGEFEASKKYLIKDFEQLDHLKNYKEYSETLFWLIIVNLEENKIAEAKKYLQILQQNIEKKSNRLTQMESQLASALFLKRSKEPQILAKAKKILLEIINKETVDYHLTSIAYFNLIELMLKEAQNSREKQQLQEIDLFIERHFKRAQEIDSKIEIVENLWLKANALLLKYNVKEAQLLFEEGENLSEEAGLRRLGLKFTRAITIIKENLPEQPLSIANPSEETTAESEKVDKEIVKMIDKQTIAIEKMEKEEPVLLLVVYEGGVTVFSKKFSSKELIDEMFVGGFLTAIDAFMHQTFATRGSIEKIQHQEYTLLLKIENPLLFCYVYKGQSFTAVQKLNQLIQKLKNSESLWSVLTKNHGEQIDPINNEELSKLAEETFLRT